MSASEPLRFTVALASAIALLAVGLATPAAASASDASLDVANAPPCGPDTQTIADVGPVHVYLGSVICFPRVDYDDEWGPEDELGTTASSPLIDDSTETETTASPPCGPGTETIVEVGPVHVWEDSFCLPHVDYDDDWQPEDEL